MLESVAHDISRAERGATAESGQEEKRERAMLQVVEVVVLVPLVLCTAVNAFGAVSVRVPVGGRRLDTRAAVWCAVVALAGLALLLMALFQDQ